MRSKVLTMTLLLLVAGVAFAQMLPKQRGSFREPSVVSDSTADSLVASGSYQIPAGELDGYNALRGWVVFKGPIGDPTVLTALGAGLDDSVIIRVTATWHGERHVLDTMVGAGLPETLRVMIPAAAGTDTLLKGILGIEWVLYDSIGDTTVTLNYRYDYSFDFFQY